jgi:hypothetical protein
MIGKVEHPERVLNTHYQQPPELNAVELMSCGKTEEGIIDALMKKLPHYGLVPFWVRRESDGFIFNRIWAAIKRECLMVVEEGVAPPEDVDAMWEIFTRAGVPPLGSWTASAWTSCWPSRSTTPPCVTASRKVPVSSCANTLTRDVSASRREEDSTTILADVARVA